MTPLCTGYLCELSVNENVDNQDSFRANGATKSLLNTIQNIRRETFDLSVGL